MKFSTSELVILCVLVFGVGLLVGGGFGYEKGAAGTITKVVDGCYQNKEYVLERNDSVKLTLQCSVVLK